MGANNGDIPFFRAGIIRWNILLHSKSKFVLMSSFNGARSPSYILTSRCMFDDAKVREVFLECEE